MSNAPDISGRRKFLTLTTGVVGAIGAATLAQQRFGKIEAESAEIIEA